MDDFVLKARLFEKSDEKNMGYSDDKNMYCEEKNMYCNMACEEQGACSVCRPQATTKPEKKVKKSDDKNMDCNMTCEDGKNKTTGNPCESCYTPPKKDIKQASSDQYALDYGWDICKEQPCGFRGCGASSADGPEMCVAGENPAQCQRRRATAKHSGKAQRRRGGKVKHLEIGDDY